MAEVYSSGERALIFSIISIFSIVASLVFLCLVVDRQKTSWFIFVICLIYSAFFAFLVIIAMFDLVFNNQEGFQKFSGFISKFYDIFDYMDKILGFGVFPWLIYVYESGHPSCCMKCLDGLIGIFKELFLSFLASYRILISGAILTILIIYRKHYGLGKNPLDYLLIILDCYAILEIYICVGFFMVQIFVDCKRHSKNNGNKLIHRYYRYSTVKIIDKTDSYYNKMKKLHEDLNQTQQNYEDGKSSSNLNFHKETLQKIEDQIRAYDSEASNLNLNSNNVIDTNNINKGINIINTDINENINKNNNQSELNKPVNTQYMLNQKVEIKENEKGKEKKKDNVTCKKKYKKYVRRIDKLKKLYKEIGKEYKEDLNQNEKNNKCCKCYSFILFLAFFIAVLSDFILPIALNLDENYINDDDKYEKEESTYSLIVGVIISVVLSVVCNSYTVIVIYSTLRRRYITGDFLYDKKINDNINLLKTIQLICGFSFSLVYCNLYLWRTLDKENVFGKPYFYEHTIIPDYTFKNGISVYMIIKIIIIFISMFASFVDIKVSDFKSDLTEYNSCCKGPEYDSPQKLSSVIAEKQNAYNILNN